MRRLDKESHWFIDGNNISRSLMGLHTTIKVDFEREPHVLLEVTADGVNKKTYPFLSMEEAVSFINNTIREMRRLSDVKLAYINKYGIEPLLPKLKFDLQDERKVIFNEEDIKWSIIDYFNMCDDIPLSVEKELTIKDGQTDIHFYLVEHYPDQDKTIRNELTEEDLTNSFKQTLDYFNLDLVDFKYVGGIHRVGYFFDQDTPFFS